MEIGEWVPGSTNRCFHVHDPIDDDSDRDAISRFYCMKDNNPDGSRRGWFQCESGVALRSEFRAEYMSWVGHSLPCGFVMVTHDNNNEWPTLSLANSVSSFKREWFQIAPQGARDVLG